MRFKQHCKKVNYLILQADLGSDVGGGVCCYIQLLILSDIGQVVFDAVIDLRL